MKTDLSFEGEGQLSQSISSIQIKRSKITVGVYFFVTSTYVVSQYCQSWSCTGRIVQFEIKALIFFCFFLFELSSLWQSINKSNAIFIGSRILKLIFTDIKILEGWTILIAVITAFETPYFFKCSCRNRTLLNRQH